MIFKYSTLLLSFLMSISLLANEGTASDQSEPTRYLETHVKVDLGFSGLGLSLETPFSDKLLFEIAAGVGAGYRVDEDFRYRLYFNNPAVFASIHGKYYYKLKNRADKGGSVDFNAGNFFGIKAKYVTPTLCEEKTWHTLLTGFHWGIQRKMGKHFLYQLNLGVGAAIDLNDKTSTHVTLFPDFNFRVSYVLPFK